MKRILVASILAAIAVWGLPSAASAASGACDLRYQGTVSTTWVGRDNPSQCPQPAQARIRKVINNTLTYYYGPQATFSSVTKSGGTLYSNSIRHREGGTWWPWTNI